MPSQHTVTALVQNEAGTINRLVSLFRRRGFSLESFNAGDCEDPGFSRITLVLNANAADLHQCLKQLEKVIDVVEVEDLSDRDSVRRETCLVRVEPTFEQRQNVYNVVNEFMAKTPRATAQCIVVEYTADVINISRLIEALRPFNVTEVVRSGAVAIKVIE
ncbi:MAG: acetolactate synthase small subunit [Fimbriimonas sp.]